MKVTKSQLFTSAALIAAATVVIGYHSRKKDTAKSDQEIQAMTAEAVRKSFADRPELPRNPVTGYVAEDLKREDKSIVFHTEPIQIVSGPKLDLALDRFVVQKKGTNPIYQFPAVKTPQELLEKMREVAIETGEKPMMVAYKHKNLRIPENMFTFSDTIFVKSTDHTATKAAAEKLGLSFLRESFANKSYLVFDAMDNSPFSAIQSLEALSQVASVSRVQLGMGREVMRMASVNDPYYKDQWHLKNTGQANSTPGEDANVEEAWDIAVGSGIVIGVVDDGVQHNHPDLAPNLADFHLDTTGTIYTYDDEGNITGIAVIDDDTSPAEDEDDNHGTAVAGVAAARGNNSIGVSGAAPYAKISGVRIGFGAEGNLAGVNGDEIQGLSQSWESFRTHIKNNSWGRQTPYGFADDSGVFMDSIEDAGTDGRGGLGTVITVSAGNSRGAGNQSIKSGWLNSHYVIPVVALSNRGGHTSYSDFGPHMVIGSSSGNSDQSHVATTDRTGTLGYNTGLNPGELSDSSYTNTFSGTSSACPLVSGCIALMLQANPNLTTRDIKEILMRTAVRQDLDPRGWVLRDGYRSDLPPIKHHHDYGGGRIDAGAAVKMARDWLPLGTASDLTRTIARRFEATYSGGAEIVFDFTADPSMRVEHVTIDFPHVPDVLDEDEDNNITELVPGLQYDFVPDMDIEITAPDGSVSIMHYGDLSNEGLVFGAIEEEVPNGSQLTSVRHWGVSSKGANGTGVWRVRVADSTFNYDLDGTPLGMILRNLRLTLTGTALPSEVPSSISISNPDGFDFGTQVVGNDYTRTFHISNTGGNPMFVDKVSFVDEEVFSGSFSGMVLPGATRSFDVTFSPDSARKFAAVLSIQSTAETGLSYVSIKGEGSVAPIPEVTKPANINLRSSSTISIPVASTYAVSFTAKGLPRGMSIDSKTGVISGSSSVPGAYNVKITATNPWGVTSTDFTIVIDPLVSTLQGDYSGIISRAGEVNDNWGGIVQLKVMPNGSYSGSISMGRVTVPLRGFAAGSSGANPTINQVVVASNKVVYRLNIEFMPDQTLTGSLSFTLAGSELVAITGWRNGWSTGNFPTPGIFNHRVSLETATLGELTIPQGHGYFSQTISAKGKATTRGITAEGQRFSSSSDIGFAGQYTIWSHTHSKRGIVQSNGSITGNSATGSGFAIKTLFEPRTGRIYREGYGITTPVNFVTSGGLYVAPTLTTSYLGKTPGTSAEISFAHANIATSQTNPTTIITLGALGALTIPQAGTVANPSSLSLRINPRNGLVSGRMILNDPNRIEPFSPYNRVISFGGLVEPSTNKAYGFFLLNQLPPLKGLPIPLNKTTLLSGSWILQ